VSYMKQTVIMFIDLIMQEVLLEEVPGVMLDSAQKTHHQQK